MFPSSVPNIGKCDIHTKHESFEEQMQDIYYFSCRITLIKYALGFNLKALNRRLKKKKNLEVT